MHGSTLRVKHLLIFQAWDIETQLESRKVGKENWNEIEASIAFRL